MSDLIFEVTQEDDGGYVAECMTESIFTQGDTWVELRENVRDAVAGFFFDSVLPKNKIGTLNAILRCVAQHKSVLREGILGM